MMMMMMMMMMNGADQVVDKEFVWLETRGGARVRPPKKSRATPDPKDLTPRIHKENPANVIP